MTKLEVKARVDKLKNLINTYRYHRLVLDKPVIEESVEDSLKKELFDLEQQFPELVTPDSPTQRVGGESLKEFQKVKHPQRMLSFNDAFDRQDMEDWEKRLKRIDPQATKNGFYCELKIDGLAIELIYENEKFKTGSTRGDGVVGENVTQNLKTIEAIPLKLTTNHQLPTTNLVVRGEVFITRKEFERINQEQKNKGLPVYANPRNLAAGSIRQLDPKVTASRKMDSFAYSLVSDLGQQKHEEEHKTLKELGFKTNSHNKFCKDLDEAQKFRDYWEKNRQKLDYEIDGVVVIVNDNKMFQKLGIVGKAPRAAIAYKFSPKESTTKIKDIIVSVGRTGTLTPIALLEPVEIGGTTVSRATLHNEDEIKRLDIKIGDTVVISRAGDVIPDIKRVIKELRTGKEKTFRFPDKCPVCSRPVKRATGKAAHRCLNKNCPAIKRETLYHFVSKGAIDIDGLGPRIVDQLMDVGLIKDAADFYSLKKEDILNLERFADKSAENLISAIQNRKKIPLDRFIFALGIPHVGSETALDLARKFNTLEKLASTGKEELLKIKDIGEVMAESIYGWFRNANNQKIIRKFRKTGLRILEQESAQTSSKLKNKIFVFTGALENISREQAEELVRQNGGDASSSVSRETSFVVAGKEPGSKYEKAKNLGVKVLNEKEFLQMVT